MEHVRSPTVKFSKPVFTCGDGLRFATPEIVARYRARRLKTAVLADISCGIGGQTVFFAKECDTVYGIDIDSDKLECARKNAEVFEVDNITFIEGNALSPRIIKQVADADIIFSDPARPAAEPQRNTGSLRPGIPQVMDLYGSDQFAFEAPPQIPPERIDFDCEREYVSVDGTLNRLTLYFGPLKTCDCSAVILRDETVHKLDSIDTSYDTSCISKTDKLKIYAFEPDPAVVKAGILGELATGLNNKVDLIHIDARRSLMTSDLLLNSPFFKNRYRVLDNVPYDYGWINRALKKNGCGTALIRFNVLPGQYWDIRNRIEQGLTGEKTAHLYKISDVIYILETL
jgi:hypothetical protein